MTDSITVTIKANETLPLDALKAKADEAHLPYTEAEDGSGIVVVAADRETADFWTERGTLWGQQPEDDDDEANTVLPGDSTDA